MPEVKRMDRSILLIYNTCQKSRRLRHSSPQRRGQEDGGINPPHSTEDINTEVKRMEGFILLILPKTSTQRSRGLRHSSPHPRHQHRGQEDGGIHPPHPTEDINTEVKRMEGFILLILLKT
jgi:hypothetical protein